MIKTTTTLAALIGLALVSSASATVTMDWVTVGNANNAADTTGYGAVDHSYQIGKYEVTNTQYAEFLNAKGQSNTNGIYNASMSGYGITQSGSSENFSYTVTTALAKRPVVYVSWFDAARFANWMMNGQGSSDMEDGAYTLNNATSGIITANIGAQVYLPSENEWYKAAYYNTANSNYSLYANGQNTITTLDANYNSSVGSSTNVGSYGSDASSYGTFDQSGNVWEWNDGIVNDTTRGLRGGSNNNGANALESLERPTWQNSGLEIDALGFRVASVATVPEPTSMFLSMLAGGMLLIRRKR